jgi:hypothetical protein
VYYIVFAGAAAPPVVGELRVEIESFFDVFFEISLDGGQSWFPSSGPTSLRQAPEPDSLVLIGAGLAALVLARLRLAA